MYRPAPAGTGEGQTKPGADQQPHQAEDTADSKKPDDKKDKDKKEKVKVAKRIAKVSKHVVCCNNI